MSMRWTTVSDRDFTLMRDEFGNYSHAADKTPISFQEQKKILGNRIKRLPPLPRNDAGGSRRKNRNQYDPVAAL